MSLVYKFVYYTLFFFFCFYFCTRRATVKSKTKTRVRKKKKKNRNKLWRLLLLCGVFFCVNESCKRLSSLISQNKRKLIKFLRKVLWNTENKTPRTCASFISLFFLSFIQFFFSDFAQKKKIYWEKDFRLADFNLEQAIWKKRRTQNKQWIKFVFYVDKIELQFSSSYIRWCNYACFLFACLIWWGEFTTFVQINFFVCCVKTDDDATMWKRSRIRN